MRLAITGGRLHDPARGIDGEVRDIRIEDGRIVEPRGDFVPERTIDARGRVVMPGGVDVHAHIAGPAVNRARRLLAGTHRAAPAPAGNPRGEPLVPAAESTGIRYALLGYTTAVDAAISPSGSRQAALELADTPDIDRAFLLLLANHELLLGALEHGETEAAREAVAWLLARTGAWGIKSVNAGGVAHWKRHGRGVGGLADPLDGRRIAPRDILRFLAEAADRLGLPHPLHVHASHLGRPGNIDTTLETTRCLEGLRHHLAHAQFHAYGRDGDGRPTSAAPRLAERVGEAHGLTLDVGQVMFGDALTLSADEEVEHFLRQVTGSPSVQVDTELETGCGTVPITYRTRSHQHALQWMTGIELLLCVEDPWRIALSTDHPNGASFLCYPAIMAQLMSRDLRREALARVPAGVAGRGVLRELDREYTLGEIATITRAAPARILGLERKGHLGPGADADVTVYDENEDREAMFRWPRWVVQAGEIVVEDGEPRERTPGRTHRVAPPSDPAGERLVRGWYAAHGSFHPDRLGRPSGAAENGAPEVPQRRSG